ncbi:MAG: 50S ribosomal protein L6 [Planctomycetota bacterium]
MSRIGKIPVAIPKGVTIAENARRVVVKGPKGTLELDLRPEVAVAIGERELHVEVSDAGSKQRETRAYHGLTRALINNMVRGVSEGYGKTLEIVGVGWNAQVKGKRLALNIGFCHPVEFAIPDGIAVETPKPILIVVTGADKQAVGQFAANVRAVRPPEPYKGKGIRYQDEHVRRKAGKTFGS